MRKRLSVPTVSGEFEYAQLGDERRTKRLQVMAQRWSEAPGDSVLQSSKSSAQAEGAYRFLNNRGFTYVPIVEAHVEQSYDRVSQEGVVIVAHDTTAIEYGGEVLREGLSPLRGKDQGFLAHVSLAIAGDGSRRPLGVVAFVPWVRGPLGGSKKNGKKRSGADYAGQEDKESARWWQSVDEVSARARCPDLIHVMDREADAYPLLTRLVANQHRFVVRLCRDRAVRTGDDEPTESLSNAVQRLQGRFALDVPISRRAASTVPRRKKTFAPRESRLANLQFAATTLQLRRPRYLTDEPEWLTGNVVHVREVDAPAGADPVEWLLVTSDRIDTVEQVQAVVERYRTRWVIEEYFKALKTGCAIEKRQHESYDALLKVTAICLPIAWRMLLLRTLARAQTEAPATAALTPTQVAVLVACSAMKLPANPSARHAFQALALLGGHHKSNGEPGWLVLGRGMEYLLTLERGWLARDAKNEIDV
jgi:hypothetical protein